MVKKSPRSFYKLLREDLGILLEDETFACDIMVVFIAREDVPWDRLGKLRTDTVRISGTSYVSDLPQVETVRVKMDELKQFVYDNCLTGL